MRLRRVFGIVLVLIAVVLAVAVVSGFQLYGSAVEDHESDNLQTTAETTATQLDGLLEERARTVDFQSRYPVVLGPDDQRRTVLTRFVEATSFQGVSVIDADGQLVAIESAGLSETEREELLGSDLSDRAYFQAAIDGESYISEPVEAETDNFIVTISEPIEQNDETVGTLNAALHFGDSEFFESIAPDPESDLAMRIESGDSELFSAGPWNDPDLSTASHEVESTGWEVTVARSTPATQQTYLVTLLQFGAGFLVIGTLAGFGLWVQRSSLRQIDELLDGFDRLANREYGTEISIGGAEEWNVIGERFNSVSQALASHERELTQYREIVEHVDDPIKLQDRDGNYRLVNDATTAFTGHSRDEVYGNDESLFLDADTASFIDEKKTEVLETESQVQYELTATCSETGEKKIFSTRRYPYYDESDELVGTIAICRDITNLKEREQELRQYKRAIDEATDLICAIDADRNFLFANPQYRAYHGIETPDVTQLDTADVFDQSRLDTMREFSNRAITGEPVQYQTTRIHPERGERIVDVRYYPLGESETDGFVAVLRDVTEREERAQQLRVVDRILRHNLRNDLTVIRLEAERIAAGSEGTVAEAADDILVHADTLLTTSDKSRSITEVLSKSPDPYPIDVSQILERLVESYRESHPETTITLDAPERAVASGTGYLEEAFEELVRNAIEHNSSETPRVDLEVSKSPESLTVRVIDNGPGIPEMDRDVLEKGRPIEDLYHGSGLGLWMVYWIVQRSGGSITVSDTVAGGTKIEIELHRAE